jgi:hypothetical protein
MSREFINIRFLKSTTRMAFTEHMHNSDMDAYILLSEKDHTRTAIWTDAKNQTGLKQRK